MSGRPDGSLLLTRGARVGGSCGRNLLLGRIFPGPQKVGDDSEEQSERSSATKRQEDDGSFHESDFRSHAAGVMGVSNRDDDEHRSGEEGDSDGEDASDRGKEGPKTLENICDHELRAPVLWIFRVRPSRN